MKNAAPLLSLLLCAVSLTAASPKAHPQPPQATTAGTAFSPDKGKFRILLAGKEVGTEDFDLTSSGATWTAKSEAVLRVPGAGDTRSSGSLTVAADGTPLHYEWSAQTDKKATGSVTFEDGTAKTTNNLPGKNPMLQDFKFTSPRIAVLDNNIYDQYAILARLYDWNAKGAQSFPVLIPQDVTPGTIEIQSVGPQSTEGGNFEALRARTADVEIMLYFDARHHLMRLEVPAAKVVVARQ